MPNKLTAEQIKQFRGFHQKTENVTRGGNFWHSVHLFSDPGFVAGVEYQSNFIDKTTKHYAEAYVLASKKLGKINIDDVNHQRHLAIAYKAVAGESWDSFDANDALDLLEMKDLAGRFSSAGIDEFKMGAKFGGKLPWLGKIINNFSFLVDLFVDEYKGINQDDLKKIPKLTNLSFYEEMIKRKLLIDPKVHLDILLPILDKQAKDLNLSEDKQKAFIKEQLNKIENIYKKQFEAAAKENNEILKNANKKQPAAAEKKIDPHEEQLRRQEESEVLQRNINNMKGTCHFLNDLGRVIKNPEIQKFAKAANALVDVYGGFKLLQDTFANRANIPGINMFDFMNPIGMVGSAVFTIFSGLFQEDEESPFQVIMEQLQHISKQIECMHQEMRVLFEQSFENDRLIYEKICLMFESMLSGFNHFDKLIQSQFQNLSVPVLELLNSVKLDLNRLIELIKMGIQELKLDGLEDVIRSAEDFKVRRITNREAVQQIYNSLLDWTIVKGPIPPKSASAFLTGAALFEANKENKEPENWAKEVIGKDPSHVLGYLERYLSSILKIKLNIPKAKKLDNALLCNPVVWSIAMTALIEFREAMNELIVDPGHSSLEKLKEIGENILTFIESIQHTPELFSTLFDSCRNSLNEIQSCIKTAFNKENKEIYSLVGLPDDKIIDVTSGVTEALKVVDIFKAKGKLPRLEAIGQNSEGSTFLANYYNFSFIQNQILNNQDIQKIPTQFFLLHKLKLGQFNIQYKIIETAMADADIIGKIHLSIRFKYHSQKDPVTLFEEISHIPNAKDGKDEKGKPNDTFMAQASSDALLACFRQKDNFKKLESTKVVSSLWNRRKPGKVVSQLSKMGIANADKAIENYLLQKRAAALNNEPYKNAIYSQLKTIVGNLELIKACSVISGYEAKEMNLLDDVRNMFIAEINQFLIYPEFDFINRLKESIKFFKELKDIFVNKPANQKKSLVADRLHHILLRLANLRIKIQLDEAKKMRPGKAPEMKDTDSSNNSNSPEEKNPPGHHANPKIDPEILRARCKVFASRVTNLLADKKEDKSQILENLKTAFMTHHEKLLHLFCASDEISKEKMLAQQLVDHLKLKFSIENIKEDICDVSDSISLWIDEQLLKKMKSSHCPKAEKIPVTPSEKLQHQVNQYGFNCVDVKPDGNCFFHAVMDQIALHKIKLEKGYGHLDFRTLISSHLEKNIDRYKGFDINLDKYIQDIKVDGYWASDLAIRALSRELMLTIVVIEGDENKQPIVYKPEHSIGMIYIGCEIKDKMGTHFQSLHPDPLSGPEKRKLIANMIDQTETDKFVKVPENQGPKINNNAFFGRPGSNGAGKSSDLKFGNRV